MPEPVPPVTSVAMALPFFLLLFDLLLLPDPDPKLSASLAPMTAELIVDRSFGDGQTCDTYSIRSASASAQAEKEHQPFLEPNSIKTE